MEKIRVLIFYAVQQYFLLMTPVLVQKELVQGMVSEASLKKKEAQGIKEVTSYL